jgi:hypothetical protein
MRHIIRLTIAVALLALLGGSRLCAQGVVTGEVTNSDAGVPADGEISFFGFLGNTDDEIRLESSDGAGYETGNWYDDLQNYGSEQPDDPYDFYFFNAANGEGFHLEGFQPNNSFQDSIDVTLGSVAWPPAPVSVTARRIATGVVQIAWSADPGPTFHVYRRERPSNGSLFRIDDPTGSLANPGVSTTYYVDENASSSGYDYVVVAEDGSGNLSPHSAIASVTSSTVESPVLVSIDPAFGSPTGGTPIEIIGEGFDTRGLTASVGGTPVTSLVIVSPSRLTGEAPSGSEGAADVIVTNTASGLLSNTLTGGFTYTGNRAPELAELLPTWVLEGDEMVFGITATDPDNDALTYLPGNIPPTAMFVDSMNGAASFNWQTQVSDAGFYDPRIVVTDGDLSDTAVVTVVVVASPPCCEGRRGDVNVAGVFPTEIDSSDLGRLVQFLFDTTLMIVLPCTNEADVDALGGPFPIDSSDLGALVSFLFSPPGSVILPDCP